jgi:hypothetical protein
LEGQLRKAQQVCETLDTAAGIDWCVVWAAPPAEAAEAASARAMAAAAAADDLLEQPEPCHAAEAGAAIKAAREEAADFAQLYERLAAASSQAGEAASLEQQQQEEECDDPGDELGRRQQEWEAWQALPPVDQLASVLSRLRDRYCYCLYCGCRYDSDSDMQQHCPGRSEAEHE